MEAKNRTAIGSLVLAASTLIGLALSEGYTDSAVVPVPGDRPTKGFGTTFNPDGSPVKMGDKTTPQRALVDLLRDAGKFDQAVKRCAPVPMYPYEFSAYVQLAYNVGEGAVCGSSIPAKLKAGDYAAACRTILDFDKARDPSKPKVLNPRTRRMEFPTVLLNLTTENGGIVLGGTAGTIEHVITHAQTEGVAWRDAVYDTELTYPGGKKRRIMHGSVSLSPEITRA